MITATPTCDSFQQNARRYHILKMFELWKSETQTSVNTYSLAVDDHEEPIRCNVSCQSCFFFLPQMYTLALIQPSFNNQHRKPVQTFGYESLYPSITDSRSGKHIQELFLSLSLSLYLSLALAHSLCLCVSVSLSTSVCVSGVEPFQSLLLPLALRGCFECSAFAQADSLYSSVLRGLVQFGRWIAF